MIQFAEEEKTEFRSALQRKPTKSGLYEVQCSVRARPMMVVFTKNTWRMRGGWGSGMCQDCQWRGLRKEYKE